jgi:hypothetical protein
MARAWFCPKPVRENHWTIGELCDLAVVIAGRVRDAFNRLKPDIALDADGMDVRTRNFHHHVIVRPGFPEAAMRMQELDPALRAA